VLETERANVVALLEGVLVSPPPDGRLLAGVTVTLAFAAAGRLGVPAAFRPVSLADLAGAGEVFCTSAVRGLAPAVLAGWRPAGDGRARAGGAAGGDEGIVARLGPALFESWGR
jgi:D-alanine transaminase